MMEVLMAEDYEEMTFQARQAATAVYDALGPGFNENTYRSALVMELTERKIPFQGDKIIEVKYKDKAIDTYKLDFVLYDKILLKIIAVGEYHPKYKSQVVSQIKAAKFKIGLLVDFGMQKLEVHKILNPEFYFTATPQSETQPKPSKERGGEGDSKRQSFDNLFKG
jgi:GxxExxY protein